MRGVRPRDGVPRPAGAPLKTTEVRDLLRRARAELVEHDAEYRHRTPPELLLDLRRAEGCNCEPTHAELARYIVENLLLRELLALIDDRYVAAAFADWVKDPRCPHRVLAVFGVKP